MMTDYLARPVVSVAALTVVPAQDGQCLIDFFFDVKDIRWIFGLHNVAYEIKHEVHQILDRVQ